MMCKKYSRIFSIIGILFVVISFLINPFTIQQTIIPDGNLQDINKIYFVYILEFLLFCFGIYIYLKSKKLLKKEVSIQIIMFISFIMACVLFLEYTSFLGGTIFLGKDYFKPAHGLIMKNIWIMDKDRDLGYVPKKNDVRHAIKAYPNGKTIFDVTYTTDIYGRRIINQPNSLNNKHIILFGCSFAFGEGLNDQDTFQYYIQRLMPGYFVYNYAVSGYGPQQMLAVLESKRLPQEVQSTSGIGVYVLFEPNSIARLIGSTEIPWGYEFPYYTLDKNQEIMRKENFFSDKTPLTYLYSTYSDLRNKSAFLQLLNINFPLTIKEKDVFLFYKLIEKSKKLYEEQFDGTFYVLIHPLTEYSNDVVKLICLLVDHHIPILQYPLDPTSKEYRIVGDGHPNGKTNQLLSVYMAPLLTRIIKK